MLLLCFLLSSFLSAAPCFFASSFPTEFLLLCSCGIWDETPVLSGTNLGNFISKLMLNDVFYKISFYPDNSRLQSAYFASVANSSFAN